MNTYLHFRSFHPHHLRSNIPYGQFLRVKRNSSSEQDYRTHSQQLCLQFSERQYPRVIVQNALQRASTRDCSTLFERWKNDQRPGISWSLDYTPRTRGIVQIIRRHWHIISEIPGCETFPTVGYKRTRSLKEILVSADRSNRDELPTNLPPGHFRCRMCSVCSISTDCKEIEFPDLGFTHRIRQFSNCNSRFCVYLLTCPCGFRYVGSTRRKLKIRIQEHISRIRHKVLEAPLVQHFVDSHHSEKDFTCAILETIKEATGTYMDFHRVLLQREFFWIFRLKSLIPNGLNQEMDSVFF